MSNGDAIWWKGQFSKSQVSDLGLNGILPSSSYIGIQECPMLIQFDMKITNKERNILAKLQLELGKAHDGCDLVGILYG